MSDAIEEGSSGVRQALRTLLGGEAYITQALRAVVDVTDPRDRKAVAALEAVGALKPEDADRYFLHPGLRSYLGDHLRRRSSFETLTRIAPEVQALRSMWQAIREITPGQDREEHEEQMRHKAVTVRFYMARNLEVIKELVATQYGDVDNIDMKVLQNQFYMREVASLISEIEQVDLIGRDMMEDAHFRGRIEVMTLISRHLIVPQGEWRSQLLASQAEIHAGLTKARRLKEDLFRVAQASRWLRTHRDQDGFDVPVSFDAPKGLFDAEVYAPTPRADLTDDNRMMMSAFMEAARGMPAPRQPAAKKEPLPPSSLIEDEEQVLFIEVCPIEKAIEDIEAHLIAIRKPVCLATWRQSRPSLHEVDREEWLMRANAGLALKKFDSQFSLEPDLGTVHPFEVNQRYSTIIVLPKRYELPAHA